MSAIIVAKTKLAKSQSGLYKVLDPLISSILEEKVRDPTFVKATSASNNQVIRKCLWLKVSLQLVTTVISSPFKKAGLLLFGYIFRQDQFNLLQGPVSPLCRSRQLLLEP